MPEPKYRRDLYKKRPEDEYIEKQGDEYACGFADCGKRFSAKSLNIARQHVISAHLDGGRYQCSQCDNTYATPSALEKHVWDVHEANRIKCDECNRSVADLEELARHKKRNHSGVHEPKYKRKGPHGTQPEDGCIEKVDEGYKCQKCPRKFSSKDLNHARKHAVSSHGAGQDPVEPQARESELPGPATAIGGRIEPSSAQELAQELARDPVRDPVQDPVREPTRKPGPSHRAPVPLSNWLGVSPVQDRMELARELTREPGPSHRAPASLSNWLGISPVQDPVQDPVREPTQEPGPSHRAPVSLSNWLGISPLPENTRQAPRPRAAPRKAPRKAPDAGPSSGSPSEQTGAVSGNAGDGSDHRDEASPSTRGFRSRPEDAFLELADGEYVCGFAQCTKTFSLKCLHKARAHVNGTHLVQREFPCTECAESYDTAAGLERHMNTFHRPKQFACDQCGKKYADKGGLDRHVRKEHLGVEQPKYTRNGPFTTKPEDAHLEKPADKYLCKFEDCTRQFSKKDLHKARNHVVSVHLGHGKFQCPVDGCDRAYADPTGLDAHMKAVHEERKFQCDECDRSFTYQCLLDHHKKIDHEGELLQCPECPKTYRAISGLEKHMFSAHSGQKAHCSECPEVFADPGSLARHFKIAHTSDKVYVQCLCGKEFQTVRDLTKHVVRKQTSAPTETHGRRSGEQHARIVAKAFAAETKVITEDGSAKYVWELKGGDIVQCGKGKVGQVKEVRHHEGEVCKVQQVTKHLEAPLHPVDLDRPDDELQRLFGKAGFQGIVEAPPAFERGAWWGAMLEVAQSKGRPTSGWFRRLCEDNGFTDAQVYDAAWILGLWIGDGTWARVEICCNARDTQEIERIEEAGQRLGLRTSRSEVVVRNNPNREEPYVSVVNVRLTTDPGLPNPMWNVIMQSGARGITEGDWKVFPQQLIYDEVEVVTWVIAGLIDSDGYVSERSSLQAEIKTIYPNLRDNVLEAARLLGWGWSTSPHPEETRLFWGKEINCKEAHHIILTGNGLSKALSKCNNAHKTRDLRHEKSSPRRKFFMVEPSLRSLDAYEVVLVDAKQLLLENGLVVPVVHDPQQGVVITEDRTALERDLVAVLETMGEEDRERMNADLRPIKRRGVEQTERALKKRREIEEARQTPG